MAPQTRNEILPLQHLEAFGVVSFASIYPASLLHGANAICRRRRAIAESRYNRAGLQASLATLLPIYAMATCTIACSNLLTYALSRDRGTAAISGPRSARKDNKQTANQNAPQLHVRSP
jgi:hypothetical protein